MSDKIGHAATPLPGGLTRRDKGIYVRIDADLYKAAMEKSSQLGLAVVIRALLRAYIRGDVQLLADDLQRELMRSPRRRAAVTPRGKKK